MMVAPTSDNHAHGLRIVPNGADAEEIVFPEGLVGCPDWRAFSLVEHAELPGIYVLQSLDATDVTFLVVHAAAIEAGYFEQLHPDDEAALAALGVGERPEVDVYCTLNTRHPERITANLLGPLVIDRAAGTARQVVLASSPWTTQHPVGPTAEVG
jgi:flagellar assembly factor FliW